MTRKASALPAEVERARLLALLNIYDAIAQAGARARLFYAADVYAKDELPTLLLAELRNQAVTLTALAPPVERAPDAHSIFINHMLSSMFPNLADLPAEQDGGYRGEGEPFR
jgi:hypothetical protein